MNVSHYPNMVLATALRYVGMDKLLGQGLLYLGQ